MMEQCPTILAFLKQLQRVPYLASKNLYFVTEYFLGLDSQATQKFCEVLKDLKDNVEKCQLCWTFKEKNNNCIFCSSLKRNNRIICVIESWRDLITIEKSEGYRGLYHVLGGLICPLDGISADDLTIKQLIDRVMKGCDELILALSQTPEGEATVAYIASKLKNYDVKISCIATGLPVGSSLESIDRLTVSKALTERRPY